MKNTIWATLLLILFTTASCKKNTAKPEPEPEPESPTAMDMRQYVIVGEYTFVLGGKSFLHPILLTFNEGGKTDIYDYAAVGKGQYNYTFSGETLTINYGGATNWVFQISNESISSATGVSSSIKNFKLYRVPETNQFSGNTFSGMLSARENSVILPFKYSFNDTQFGESNVGQPTLTYAYTVIKNLAAVTTINQVIRYYLVINGKLTVSRYDLASATPAKFFYGSITKDE
ncbi:MAG: hypothetical protein V4594_05510 [Bacteroidota bacterium]